MRPNYIYGGRKWRFESLLIEGMDVVGKTGKVKTTTRGPYRDVPVTPVIIKSVRRVDR